MEELRQEFLIEAIAALENLQTQLKNQPLSEEFQREVFRRLHTLKGTSQTFDLSAAGKLAHEIENVLQAAKDNQLPQDENFIRLLQEGIELLLETFRSVRDKQKSISAAEYVKKIKQLIPDYSAAIGETFPENSLAFLPPNYLAQISAHEKNSLNQAVAGGKSFLLIEAGFDFADFDEKFKNIRRVLSERGEIIATFPSPKYGVQSKIGFQFFFVTGGETVEIEKILMPFGADLIFQNTARRFAADVKGILAQAVLTGEKTAQKLGKKVKFETAADEIQLSNRRLKLLSEALLHLVRNAVDHAIETEGKVKIELQNPENNLLVLRIADDGRGIDVEKIKMRAINQNLISPDRILSRSEALRLIFAHGFSTSETISEISGRGVGLDAVEDSVKKAGGEIRVESEAGKGTVFEIYLPKDEEGAEE
jgi:chemotaxis protein histidine kinase CheA